MKRSNPIIEALADLLEKFETFKGTTSRKTYWLGVLSIIIVEAIFLVLLLAFSLLFFGLGYVGDVITAVVACDAFWYEYIVKWIFKAVFDWIPGCFFGLSCALAGGFPITMILPSITMAVRRTRDAIGTCLVYVAALAVSCVLSILATLGVVGSTVTLAVGSLCALVAIVLLVIPEKKNR